MNVIKVIVFWRVLDPGGEPSLARSFLPNVYATEVGGIELQYTSWALQVLAAVGPEPEARRTGMMTERLVAVASLLSFGTPSTYFKGTRPEALASFGFSRYMHGDRPQANLAQRSSRESLLLGRWRYPG